VKKEKPYSPVVLSVRQPWAWAIAWGGKNIENRTWTCHYRGPIFIHAAKRIDVAGIEAVERIIGRPLNREQLTTGAIVAAAQLVGVTEGIGEHEGSPWWEGPYGWILDDIKPIDVPIPAKGRLGLWLPSDDELIAVRRQL
jgi:ASCH domain